MPVDEEAVEVVVVADVSNDAVSAWVVWFFCDVGEFLMAEFQPWCRMCIRFQPLGFNTLSSLFRTNDSDLIHPSGLINKNLLQRFG